MLSLGAHGGCKLCLWEEEGVMVGFLRKYAENVSRTPAQKFLGALIR